MSFATPLAPPRPRLIGAQRALLRRLARGGTNGAHANALGISAKALAGRLATLRRRLGARDTRHMIVLACAWRFIDAEAVLAGSGPLPEPGDG